MRHLLLTQETENLIWLAQRDGRFFLDLDGSETEIALTPLGGARYRLTAGGVEKLVHVLVDGDHVHIHLDGEIHEVIYRDPVIRYAEEAGGSAEDMVKAPMPGTVISTPVEAGQAVEAGDVLIVIESMKLETALKAGRAGVVEAVHVAVGRTFDRDAVLVTLVPEG
jgi:acetyl/propionyl-CoA carboxylase alpha subunit